jgi:hypothetical protein
MGFFNRKKEEQDEFNFLTNDILIVFDDEGKTSDIRHITAIDEQSIIVAGAYKVPLQDCEISTGRDGRNFFYRAPSQSIRETERLARLEQSMVLSQITAYKPPLLPNSIDWTKGLLFAIIFVCVIGFIMK